MKHFHQISSKTSMQTSIVTSSNPRSASPRLHDGFKTVSFSSLKRLFTWTLHGGIGLLGEVVCAIINPY